jgi:hypothetical protein
MVRVKKSWNQNERLRSPAQMANAIGATIWKLAANVVLNMENENFETATQGQMLEDSRIDVQGEGEYQADFVSKINQRSADYADYSFSEAEGGSFAMRCRLGDRVKETMGERDGRWIPDYIVGREAPEIEAALKRSLAGLVSF